MVLWSRIRCSRIKNLTNQCNKRHYYHSSIQITSYSPAITKARVLELHRPPQLLYCLIRFFAAPILANLPKPESKVEKGTRLNDQITAEWVRLVTDEGHDVVSMREALDRAKKLKMDLVEVDRVAKPPVCKIMDYHRERYHKKVKEKERAKSKAERTLRKGSPKVIRFTEKTEQNDLQTKADTVKKMMEKGHRVKCMAVGNEDQDLGGMLARLSALIEDVAIVESGPNVEKKQAYVVVRHIKFGPIKKGSKKKPSMEKSSPKATLDSGPDQGPLLVEEESTDAESNSESENDIDTDQKQVFGEKRTTWSTFDANEDFEEVFDLDDNKGVVSSSITRHMGVETDGGFPPENVANASSPHSKPELRSTHPKSPSSIGENRYSGRNDNRYGGRSEVRSGVQPTNSTAKTAYNTKVSEFSPAHMSQTNRASGATNTVHQGSDSPYQGRQSPPFVGENRYAPRREVRSGVQPTNSTAKTAYNTKLSESPVHMSQSNRVPGATNTVHHGSDSLYQGRQSPPFVGENRYAPRREARSGVQPINSTAKTAYNTKPSASPVHVRQSNRVPGATNTLHQRPDSPDQAGQAPPFEGENRYGPRREVRSVVQPPAYKGQ